MALRQADLLAAERDRIAPHVDRLKSVVLRVDPEAQFSLQPGHDPEFWELHAYVHPSLTDDPDLSRATAEEGTEILLDFDAAVAVVLRSRQR